MRRLIRTLVLLALTGALAGVPAWSQATYYESVDVPTDLPFGAGTTYVPWRVVKNAAGAYSTTGGIAPPSIIDALFRSGGGRWLISLESAAELGGVTFEPGDVLQWDGGAVFVPFFDASTAGVPDGTNVDAVFLEPAGGDLVVSFDVPVRFGANLYQPGDLVRYAGGAFNPFFDATVAGIPDTANLTAADVRGGRLVLALDVPTTTTAGVLVLPGELYAWDGVILAPFDPQPGWPASRSSTVTSLSFLPDPGVVGPTLTVERLGAQLHLAWTNSTCSGGQDYGIYEGQIGSYYSHTGIVCTDGGVPLQEDIPLPAGNTYYLVVPHNDPGLLNPAFSDEGSYGLDYVGGAMNERPLSAGACVANQVLGCSP